MNHMKELLFGGLLGATIPVTHSIMVSPTLGFMLDSADMLKYTVAVAGIIWAAARLVQKLTDGVDELKRGQEISRENQENFYKSLATLTKAVNVIQERCQEKCLKPKTDYVVDNDYDPEHIPTPTQIKKI